VCVYILETIDLESYGTGRTLGQLANNRFLGAFRIWLSGGVGVVFLVAFFVARWGAWVGLGCWSSWRHKKARTMTGKGVYCFFVIVIQLSILILLTS
jgi:hypothetical protein